jgi:hypothetical protein
LRDEDHSEAGVGNATDERETESHGWVEEAPTDTEEDPSVDSETEAERQRDVHQRAESWRGSGAIRVGGRFSFVRDLGAGEGEEEEEECSEELADSLRRVSSLAGEMWFERVESSYSDGMAADWVRLTAGHKRWLASSVYNIALSCVGEDDEAIVDRRLNVHGCCCFLFLLLFLLLLGECGLRGGGDEEMPMLWSCEMPRRMLYVGGGRRDGNRPATWKTRCQQTVQKKAPLW